MIPFVSVIIPAHNEEKHIKQCIDSLLEQDYPKKNYEIIIVDNNSSDATKNIANSYRELNCIFKEKGPVGAVRNFGVANSSGSHLAFIDSDCVAPVNWISRGVALLQSHEKSAFGGKYDLPSNATWIEKYWLLGVRKEKNNRLDLLGGAIFIKKTDFLVVGGFDETISSGEDTKLAKELRAHDIFVEINQSLNVIHLGNAKTASDFIKRQAWHSENYLKEINTSIKDPIFLLLIIFLLAGVTFCVSIILGDFLVASFSMGIAAAVPNIFSVKRIIRAKDRKKSIKNYHKVLLIDIYYLTGRIMGILRGAKAMIFS